MKEEKELYTLRMKVVDKPGVLVRIALVFSRRGRNVSTLLVSPSLTPGFSSILVTFHDVQESLPGITGQLKKLVDVIEVESSPAG